MLKYSKIRKDLDIENMNGNAEDLAFFTHYLHNYTNGVSKSFKKRAVQYYKQQNDELSIVSEPELQAMLPIKWDIPFPSPQNPEFTFIDLFAGIGGFRIPMQEIGGKCVFSSEFNYHAQRAYELNFGEVPFGDITKLNLNVVPKHNVLCAGFPCQPFSISGKMKGFEDTRGTLIYHVFKIIEKREPEVVLLENVKHLLYHDKKRTLTTIIQHLEELGYIVSKKVLNASDFGVPQNRERIIIVGHRIYSTDGVHPALPSQESSGRFWIYHKNKVRKLTIQECYRIMGFPKEFKLINNRSELYRQVGNSVAVPMIKEVASQIKQQLLKPIQTKDAEYIS
jgi:DNA (cytosine-5)-methyltransferase 1